VTRALTAAQVEGVICDRGLTLGHLIGILAEFFRRLGTCPSVSLSLCLSVSVSVSPHAGIDELKFKPAYNPYTEPSMEIFGKHSGRWLEIGNSGIFRPEMLRPMVRTERERERERERGSPFKVAPAD
jgi:phenylalanyl-tRNA synthetase alpha chain